MRLPIRLLLATTLAALVLSLIPTRADSPESWLGLSVTFVEDGYAFRPGPARALRDVKVHTPDPILINKAWASPDWAEWITSFKTNRIRLEVDEMVARPSSLLRMGQVEGRTSRKVTALRFARLKLLLGNNSITLPAGSMEFAEDGTLSRASIDVDHLLAIEASLADGKLKTLLRTTGNWKWELAPALRFDQMVAQGTVSDDGIVFDKIGGTGFGGALDGVLRILVAEGFRVDADLQIDRMNATELLKGFHAGHTMQGSVSAKFRLQSASAPSLAELAKAVVTTSGTYSIRSGSVDRFGLLEGIRRPSSGAAGGGLTRFQTLDGSFSGATGKATSVSIRRLDGGAQSASGSFQIGLDGGLRGNITGTLNLPNGDSKSRPLVLGGSVKAPNLIVP